MSEYISDVIGDDYTRWEFVSAIFLTAPTGSGKTYFILNVLLKYAAKNKKRILYLVNRRALHDQIKNQIMQLEDDKERSSIEVKSYQELENMINYGKSDVVVDSIEKCEYVVCDEAHYFAMDSLFNSETASSYALLRRWFESRIFIFISATLECVEKRLRSDYLNSKKYRSYYYGVPLSVLIPQRLGVDETKIHKYNGNNDYKWLNVEIVNDIRNLYEMITEKGAKWLIFVDNIAEGKEIEKDINSAFIKSDGKENRRTACFLYSSVWNESEDVSEERNSITKEKRQKTNVLIATSVLDNGISLEDYALRKVVINTDTREELLQMIGRKRRTSDEKVDLYLICKKKEQIRRRLNDLERLRDSLESYTSKILQYESKKRRES